MIFHTVVAVVIANVATLTVVGVAESANAAASQFVPSGDTSSAYVHVGVAPTVVVILSSPWLCRTPPRSARLVDTPLPVCAVDRFAAAGESDPASALIVAIQLAPTTRGRRPGSSRGRGGSASRSAHRGGHAGSARSRTRRRRSGWRSWRRGTLG